MRRIAVINQKGGVGKTTTAINLSAALAHLGRRVVVVDLDPQANLSLHVDRVAASGAPSAYGVLTGACTFAEAIHDTDTPGLRIVPSNIDLSGAETELASAMGRETLLGEAIDEWVRGARTPDGRSPADYVVFDCPPSLGLLALNALATAGEVLLTVQTEFLALQGMSKLVEIVQLVRKRLNAQLKITGILPCMYDTRLRLAREVLGEIRQYFPGQVFKQPVGTNVKLAEAPSFGQTIFQYAPESKGAADYLAAAHEVLAQEGRDPELAGLPRPEAVEIPDKASSKAQDQAPMPTTEQTPPSEPAPEPAPSEDSTTAARDDDPPLRDEVLEPRPPAAPRAPSSTPGQSSEASKAAPESPGPAKPSAQAPAQPPQAERAAGPPAAKTPPQAAATQAPREPERAAKPPTLGTSRWKDVVSTAPEPGRARPAEEADRKAEEPPADRPSDEVPRPGAARPGPQRTQDVLRAAHLPPLPRDAFENYLDSMQGF